MSAVKFRYGKLQPKEPNEEEKSESEGNEALKSDQNEIEQLFKTKPEFFLLNNILLGVQFFENYERDIRILRENFYKEIKLQNHHKTCIYTDQLHNLISKNVKFQRRHGKKKNIEELLHPFRIFILYENIFAAYDPSTFQKYKPNIIPYYKLTVTPCDNDKKEKSGYVYLTEYETQDFMGSEASTIAQESFSQEISSKNINHYERNFQKICRSIKPSFDFNARRFTKIINQHHKDFKGDRKITNETIEGCLSYNTYYKYIKPSARLNMQKIDDFRMHQTSPASCLIPKKCFQILALKQSLNVEARTFKRKSHIKTYIKNKTVLNAAAFKGNFCDVLIENLKDELNFELDSLKDSVVHQEFIIVNQKGYSIHVTPVINILDWNNFIKFDIKLSGGKINKSLKWPSDKMEGVIRCLPCILLPTGFYDQFVENKEYEREWKIEFPKCEEYLLLHTMHSQLRCFLFALGIYKTFIEMETNSLSFGPKHLLHLWFWKIQKNFLAWPDDTPGETLIDFLQTLYKNLQKKIMPDFFMKSRNLFANSNAKDLHRAQFILKMILDNPVPYIMKVIANLRLKDNFYKTFEILKLHEILKTFNIVSDKPKKHKKVQNEKKKVIFEEEETKWRKSIIKQIKIEKKTGEEQLLNVSTESIDIEELPLISFETSSGHKMIELFISHFLDMGFKSIEYEDLDQAELYFFQTEKLIMLLRLKKSDNINLPSYNKRLHELKENCFVLSEILKKREKTEEIKILEENQKQNSENFIDGNLAHDNEYIDQDKIEFKRKENEGTLKEVEGDTKL